MILVGLGSSLTFCGRPPQDIVERAIAAIGRFAKLVGRSRLYRSPAWPDPRDPEFVNAVVAIETGLSPHALMAGLHAIEAGFGRRRGRRNGPRTLDLDLLDYDSLVVAEDRPGGLILPHPRLEARDFVLAPLAEIAPDWRHPVSGAGLPALLAGLESRAAEPLPA